MRTGRILVVEDESVIARQLQLQLSTRGHTVVGVASSGAAALQLAESTRPDLALMDIQLSGAMDGVRTACALRERFGIPSVFLSSFSDDETVERTQGANPFGYVIKPHDERLLHITVQSALYRRLAELEHAGLQEERLRADRAEATARLAASVVHDVNNLLSAIRMNAYQLQNEPNLGAELHDIAADITAAVAHGEALMHELVSLARGRRGTPLSIEVAALVKDTARRGPQAEQAAAEPNVTAPAAARAQPGAPSRGTVLITDDDPVVRRAVGKILRTWGCRVLEAKEPSEALAFLETETIDLLLTDLVMPQMSGYQLARIAAQRSPDLSVIYMSGYEPETLAAETDGGDPVAGTFLQKPFDVDVFKELLGEVLQRHARP